MPSDSSCLLHVLCFAETQYQTESKWDKNGRRFFWNIYDFWEVKSTRDGARGGHETGAHAHSRWARPHPPGALVRWLMPFFGRKNANFWKKIWAKASPQSDLRISGYKRNGARAESQSAETERDREIDPISEGLSALPSHGSQGPEGKPFSHLGRRSRKKKKEGALSSSLPVAPECHQGPSSSLRSSPTPLPSSPTSPSPSPFYLQRLTLPQPAVPST